MKQQKPTVKKKDNSDKKIVSLSNEIENLKKELKNKEDQFLRSIADYQNYQKRIEKETELIKEETKKKYLSELIDLNELLKKAYEDNNPKDGLKLMINNIEKLFEKEQIKCIDCVGKKFDHNIHHAVTTVNKDDCEDNLIIEEVKKGYTINEKLLRPSKVIVVKKEKKV
jgi:molecular chaperone GrpE